MEISCIFVVKDRFITQDSMKIFIEGKSWVNFLRGHLTWSVALFQSNRVQKKDIFILDPSDTLWGYVNLVIYIPQTSRVEHCLEKTSKTLSNNDQPR